MTRTATFSTMSPYAMGTGQGIYFEQARAVAEMANYAFQNTNDCHVSLCTGADDWNHDAGQEIATHAAAFSASSGWLEYYSFRIWIDVDVQDVSVTAKCFFESPDEGSVRFTVGGASAVTQSFTSASLLEQTDTIATSSTGTGWQTVLIEMNHTTGSQGDQTLDDFRVENVAAATLPAPVIE